MKVEKILFGFLSFLCFSVFAFFITSCEKKGEALAKCPTQEYVISCLEKIPNITEIEAVNELNDPNGLLNKDGGYTALVYFAIEEIDQSEVYGNGLIGKGTDAGGGIEVYKNKKDANQRNEYLAAFDGTIFASGSHTVYGTCVIRVSNELTATHQNIMEENIKNALSNNFDEIVALCPNHKWNSGVSNMYFFW